MLQIRIHGRGGQGVVTAAEMLAVAAFREGKHAQAFPSFGSERMGAPVVAFCRIDDHEIRSREPVMEPDVLIVQDPTLFHSVDVFQGVSPDGFILINSTRAPDELGIAPVTGRYAAGQVRTIPATELALLHVGRPIPNAVLLGAFAALTNAVTLDAALAAVGERFKGSVAEKNCAAAMAGYDVIRQQIPAEVGAC
ncbi:MAG TPA: 2-oxoacid:acceptor oxidoreductase family protein [Chloroflexota bacterium]|nr:2-oxoacid:acceptor oxidoreductase family protein [Chloroflexota bacterium]